jgi:hypothetical protein
LQTVAAAAPASRLFFGCASAPLPARPALRGDLGQQTALGHILPFKSRLEIRESGAHFGVAEYRFLYCLFQVVDLGPGTRGYRRCTGQCYDIKEFTHMHKNIS